MADITADVTEHIRPDGGVVAGDDGSDDAAHAVRYALEEARRRGCTLHVVRAWSILTVPRPADVPPGFAPTMSEYEAACRNKQAARVEELLGAQTDVPVEVHCVHSPAARALVEASRTADVVVVASRGVGGFSSLLLGSVAEQCIRHCAGPVVVVRRPSETD